MKRTLAVFFILYAIFTPFGAFAATDVKNDPTLPSALMGYWRLEETSGTRVSATSTNDLADIATVTSGTGKQGTAASFELDTSEYLSITDAAQSGLDITSDLSFSAWVNFQTVPGVARYDIVTKYNAGANRSYRFQAGDSNQLSMIQVGGGGSAFNVCSRAWTPSSATWYHVAAAFSDSANEIKLYVDGAQLGTTCASMNTASDNGTAEFRIGSGQDAGNFFDGLIDEVGIWSKTLSSTQVTDLYNAGAGIPYEAAAAPAGGERKRVIFNGKVIINSRVLVQ